MSVLRSLQGSEEDKIVRAQIMLLGSDLRKALERAAAGGQLTREDRGELRQWLQSGRQAKRRYQNRLRLYGIAIFLVTFAAGLLISPRIPIEGLKSNRLWVPFFISVAILLVALIKDIFVEKNVDSALKEITSQAEKTRADIHDILEKNLRPRITQLDSREKVLRAASDVLGEALKESGDERFVVFVGAASLSTQKDGKPEDEEKSSPVDEYKNKLRNLDLAKVAVKRYVDLMTTQREFVGRRRETLSEYLEWLEKQIDRLRSNPKYTLIDCKRAQPWGGSRSSIITHKAFLDIIGEGESGFLVKGDDIASTIRESSERLFEPANKHPYYSEDAKTIQLLEDVVKKLRA